MTNDSIFDRFKSTTSLIGDKSLDVNDNDDGMSGGGGVLQLIE